MDRLDDEPRGRLVPFRPPTAAASRCAVAALEFDEIEKGPTPRERLEAHQNRLAFLQVVLLARQGLGARRWPPYLTLVPGGRSV